MIWMGGANMVFGALTTFAFGLWGAPVALLEATAATYARNMLLNLVFGTGCALLSLWGAHCVRF